jgi:phage FluMu gp28-like protein
LVRRIPFVIELRNVPFRQQEQVAFYLIDRLPNFIGGAFDARGNGQFLAEFAMQRYGPSRIQQVMLTEGWYREHMPPVKAALEDGNLDKLPKDEDFLGDLRLVQVIKGVPRIPETRTSEKGSSDGRQDIAKRHGDAAVALALAYFASREMTKGPVKAITRPRSRLKRVGGINLIGYEHVN